MQKGEYTPMNKKVHKELGDFFKKHNEELFDLIGKRFDWDD